jgi:hypothetical protein
MKEYKIVHNLIQMHKKDVSAIICPSEEQIKGLEKEINGLAKEGWEVKLSNTVVVSADSRIPANNSESFLSHFSYYIILERDNKSWKDAIDGDYHG